ncbi:hypothetical protein H310_15253 [Aphanomyces invadans]|uniref:Uncharacterized protein n=1 Tax=Aphanomyces invadans TaxID=157072 RepID=A0A024T7R8_9STRA|nr:hypothetical protein H310_15253 [Aphanomyces invadans]ETV89903.1 hypothetical protein H310_15253 [Aphanomyces invadans]|eukprot:XP_008881462.1 hypothetical protein H310_15253 [Aphanomyces invadans]
MSINVFIVYKINAVHLLTSMFEVVCAEKHGKTYSLILFTKTRWGTGHFMLHRNLLLKSVLVSMRNSIDHDDKFKDVAMEPELRSAILDVSFWKSTFALEKLLKLLCMTIGHLEGDETTFSALFASFLVTAHHFSSN